MPRLSYTEARVLFAASLESGVLAPEYQLRYFVYVVRTATGALYTGVTTDVERRVREHNTSGRGAKALRGQRPVRLEWYDPDPCTKSDALRFEAGIKKCDKDIVYHDVAPTDRVEVVPWIESKGRWSFVSSDARACDLSYFDKGP